ncbi:MAG: AI-2E family transporter [Phycisphaerae bacterium]
MAESQEQHGDGRDHSDQKEPHRSHNPLIRTLVALFFWALVLILALRFLPAFQFTIMGLLASAAVAAALKPLAVRIPGPAGLQAVAAVLAVLLLLAASLGLVGWSMAGPVSDVVNNSDQLQEQINEKLAGVSQAFGLEENLTLEGMSARLMSLLTGKKMAQAVQSVLDVALGVAIGLTVVVISTIYLLSFPPEKLISPALRLLTPQRREPTRRAIGELVPELRWWVIGTLFSMTVIGVVSGVGFWLIGLKLAAALGLFAGLAQIVPTFGPLLTLVAAMLVAALQGTTQVIGVAAVYLIVQTIESYFLTPMVMRKAVKIPPIVTLFTVLLWGNLFGPAGLILAIPLDLLIWVLLKHHLAAAYDGGLDHGQVRG